jgi:hypothetical protein
MKLFSIFLTLLLSLNLNAGIFKGNLMVNKALGISIVSYNHIDSFSIQNKKFIIKHDESKSKYHLKISDGNYFYFEDNSARLDNININRYTLSLKVNGAFIDYQQLNSKVDMEIIGLIGIGDKIFISNIVYTETVKSKDKSRKTDYTIIRIK